MTRSFEDLANLMLISKELDKLQESVFILSSIVFLIIECSVLYLSTKLYHHIKRRQVEENYDDSKIAPTLFAGIFIFILSFYIGITFLGINNNYLFKHGFY